MFDPKGLIKASGQQKAAGNTPNHYRNVTREGRELGDLCPQRTRESLKGLSQSVAAICSDSSSAHLVCPLSLSFLFIIVSSPHLSAL